MLHLIYIFKHTEFNRFKLHFQDLMLHRSKLDNNLRPEKPVSVTTKSTHILKIF